MPYVFDTTPQRSSLMKKIKSTETKSEVLLRKALWKVGVRYRKNYKGLPGIPDIVITRAKIAIFVDGEFWHGWNWSSKQEKIKVNRDYWISKIESNIARDKKNNELITGMGWTIIRFWEKDVKRDLQSCVEQIMIVAQKKPKAHEYHEPSVQGTSFIKADL